jgi:lipoprotein-anchoring transpeptidase ErfK/SrfK
VSYRRYKSAGRGRRAAAVLAFVLVGLVVAAAAAPAGDTPGPTVVARGVTIAGTPVGGLTRAEAEAAVERSFARPLVVRHEGRRWQRAPVELGARADVTAAVRSALSAGPGASVPLDVETSRGAVTDWVADVGESLDRPTKESRIVLRGVRPFVSASQVGLRLRQSDAARRISQALELHARGPVELAVQRNEPKVTRSAAGPIVVIRRAANKLVLYDGMRRVQSFGVATGQPAYPTPLGSFEIVTKQRDPWWYPPASDWAQGLAPVPPGPGNPLGTRWMGISSPAVGIHGTPDAASIGYSASHGCIRMHVPEAEWLFERVEVGTPVFILA